MVNRLSASASEIFAGAMQDYGRGIVIGEDTFGKGTVQTLITLNRGQLKITSAKFYRISGASTQHRGITPDISYPSLYDSKEIGESALKEALPWDTIRGAVHQSYMDISPLIGQLSDLHEKRIKENADYLYLQAMLEYLNTMREKTRVSLSRNKREQERTLAEKTRLDLENKRRKAKGLSLLDDIDEIDETREEKKDKKASEDPVLVESGNILLDFMTLSDMLKNHDTIVRTN